MIFFIKNGTYVLGFLAENPTHFGSTFPYVFTYEYPLGKDLVFMLRLIEAAIMHINVAT